MRGQERKNAVRLQKMTRHRLRIQQFPLTIRSILHTRIITNNPSQRADRPRGSGRSASSLTLAQFRTRSSTATGNRMNRLRPSKSGAIRCKPADHQVVRPRPAAVVATTAPSQLIETGRREPTSHRSSHGCEAPTIRSGGDV
jgi:hypothetical protein